MKLFQKIDKWNFIEFYWKTFPGNVFEKIYHLGNVIGMTISDGDEDCISIYIRISGGKDKLYTIEDNNIINSADFKNRIKDILIIFKNNPEIFNQVEWHKVAGCGLVSSWDKFKA